MRVLISALSIAALIAIPAAAFAAGGFTVTSPDFANGGTIPMAQVFNSFGCTGGNHSPELY
ncbi:MAG: kinase inhibitor, partial [Gammaproteobacteria bacterium]